MSDPLNPRDPSSDPAGPAGPDGGAGDSAQEAAAEQVRHVISWYTQEIFREQRAPSPDQERVEQLKAQRQACTDDQRALHEAGPEEAARIAEHYEALYAELTQ